MKKTNSIEPIVEHSMHSNQAEPNKTEDTDFEPIRRVSGVVIGLFVGFDGRGEPLIDYPGNPLGNCLRSRSVSILTKQDQGRQVALLFEDGDPCRPLIMGLIESSTSNQHQVSANVDGETLRLTAKRQIVLQCGEASITLTRAGKVLIRGKYVLSRSSGINMVKGGIIRLN